MMLRVAEAADLGYVSESSKRDLTSNVLMILGTVYLLRTKTALNM